MPALVTAASIQSAFVTACELELNALKPGNVHIHSAGHGMNTDMFMAAAKAAAPHIAARSATLGERIENAVRASVAVAGCNTNLGIILLCAPLACAALAGNGPLRVHLDHILDHTTIADAQAVYRAIAVANPGGLGSTPEHDVATIPTISLLAAMTAARDHDRIANAYATDFADLFDFALPALHTARIDALSSDRAITTLHMCLMAQFPDTHINRKFGSETAHEVQVESHRLRTSFLPGVMMPDLKHCSILMQI